MNELDRLLADASRRGGEAPADDAALTRLRRLVGAGPASAGPRASGAAAAAQPGSVSAAASALSVVSPRSRAKRSRGRRTAGDWVTTATAVAAIAAVVGVGVLVGVESASSNEVTAAAQSLRAQEVDLRNRTTTLETSLDLYETAVADAEALADSAEAPLAGLEGRSDEPARAAALTALATFRDEIRGQSAPREPAAYRREADADQSLPAVAAQLDAVRAASLEIDAAIDETRAARSAVAASEETFRAALSALGATLPGFAAVVAGENRDAGQSYRAAVTAAADAVVAAQLGGGSGGAEMIAYAAAVDALRGENQRVIDSTPEPEPEPRSNWRPVTPVVPAPAPSPTDGGGTVTPPAPGEEPVVPVPEPTVLPGG